MTTPALYYPTIEDNLFKLQQHDNAYCYLTIEAMVQSTSFKLQQHDNSYCYSTIEDKLLKAIGPPYYKNMTTPIAIQS